MSEATREHVIEKSRQIIQSYVNRVKFFETQNDYLSIEGQSLINNYSKNIDNQKDLFEDFLINDDFFENITDKQLILLMNKCRELNKLYELNEKDVSEISKIERSEISKLDYSEKIRRAIEYSSVIDEILEEIGDIKILVTQMVVVSGVMIALAATGYGAAVEALGFVLLTVGAAFSGTELLKGIIGLAKFFIAVTDVETEEDLKRCGKLFGDSVAKIGVDGFFFVLSMFGLKKSSTQLTTKKIVDNGLNSKKWAGKKIKSRKLDIEKVSVKPPLQFNETNCHDHLIYGDGIKSGQGGVSGAHNKINFYKIINDKFEPIFRKEGLTFNANDCIESSTAHPKISGVEEIKYKLPAMYHNNTVNQGVYKKIKAPKTVYDSSIISDEQMLQWGKEAMQNGIDNGNIREGRYISGTASNGLHFEGYIDSTTNTITNFHPVLD